MSEITAAGLLIELAGATDIGCLRKSNQDRFGIDEEAGLIVVCDGMGGAAGGEVASALSVEHFVDAVRGALGLEVRAALLKGVSSANRAVLARAEAQPALEGMGSTLVAARLLGERVTIVNVGDSRAYLFWSGAGRQVTRDHSLVAEQVRAGLMTVDAAERSHLRSVITRAIGAHEGVSADLFEETLGPGDVLLLCSDGLTRHLNEEDIREVVRDRAAAVSELCGRLVAMARERGGSDNITVVLLRAAAR